jgi:hypothetical protein
LLKKKNIYISNSIHRKLYASYISELLEKEREGKKDRKKKKNK